MFVGSFVWIDYGFIWHIHFSKEGYVKQQLLIYHQHLVYLDLMWYMYLSYCHNFNSKSVIVQKMIWQLFVKCRFKIRISFQNTLILNSV